jgi:hypothetical protein
MTIVPGLTVSDTELARVCERYHVRELAVFGSAARGKLNRDSDIDVLVDFDPNARVGLLELGAIADELRTLLGRPVDLAIKRALKPRIRSEVLAYARVLYAA